MAPLSSTRAACALLATLAAALLNPPPVGSVPADFDCAWRHAAFAYALHIQPFLSDTQVAILNTSLQLGSCPTEQFRAYQAIPRVAPPMAPFNLLSAGDGNVMSVAATGEPCSDARPSARPFCTVQAAVVACRAVSGPCTALLLNGTHFLSDTLRLTAADSHLTLVGSGNSTVTGTQPVKPQWERAGGDVKCERTCQLFNNSDATSGNDLKAGYPTATAEECLSACRANDACVAGVWGDQGGGHHSCYIKHAPAAVDNVGSKLGNAAFNCTPCAPPKPWKTKVPAAAAVAGIPVLLIDGVRAIRARYPNADPEVDKFPVGYITKSTAWTPPRDLGQPTYIEYNDTRTDYVSLFKTHRSGVGGPCAIFTPPVSYWCAEHPEGGGAGQFQVPSGLEYTGLLPNAPYKTPAEAVIHAWRPGHWANWMFQADDDSNSSHFSWTVGGFQGARGNAHGQEWFVDNVLEELDSDREFYYSAAERILYLQWADGPPPQDVVAGTLQRLLDIRGASNVSVSHIKFTGSTPTYLGPHGVPSGGDWALSRTGAVMIADTEGVSVSHCNFTRLDGNAVFLSGHNLNASLTYNTFEFLGESAMASWGFTKGADPHQPPGTGPDGTGGNFSRYTTIAYNWIREIGIHEKQSSCWFQAKAAETTLFRNLCFDIPRAGFNFNDGFGGGNEAENNLLFNTCAESSDHGAINTWDRQVYETLVPGEVSTTPVDNEFHHNFIVSNLAADGGAIDNDDGSSYYSEHHNFGVFGGFKAGNFDGHSKRHFSNINAYARVYEHCCFWNSDHPGFPLANHTERYYNNTCILDEKQSYIYLEGGIRCNFSDPGSVRIIAHDNRVYSPSKSAVVSGCGTTLTADEWLKVGIDPGSQFFDTPASSEVMAWGAQLLGFALP